MRCNTNAFVLENTLLQRLRNAKQWVKDRMIEFNLFETTLTRTDLYELKTARITTRVYLTVLLLTFNIIAVYLLLPLQVHIITIQNPPQTIFENLLDKYASTLQCPCSRIVNSYQSFTSLSPTYHPVCSSLYISDAWVLSIWSANPADSAYIDIDFRVAGPTFFNTLATLCSLSKTTVDDAWYIFSQTPLITDLPLTQSELYARTKVAIEQFQNDTRNEFKRIVSLVDLHTKTMYATGYENVLLYTNELSTSTTQIDLKWVPTETDTCTCGLNNQCSDVMSFLSYAADADAFYNIYNVTFTLSDILVGCFVVSSVYKSSLGCFFNQTCLDRVQCAIKSKNSISISILDANSTRFSPNSLIGTILDNLMIESWNEKIEYDEYYEQCAPEQCTYSYTSRYNSFKIVTTLVGLLGGLSLVLRITISFIIRRIWNRLRARREANTIRGKRG